MSIETRPDAQNPPAALDPFRIGYRYVPAVGPDGRERPVMVPLTEEDFLHPQEEDRQMLNALHSDTLFHLCEAIRTVHDGQPGVQVFTDHRVDWQVAGILPHGPDVVVFDNFFVEWNRVQGTVPVRDVGARVLAVFEITSPSTRGTDLVAKRIEYHEAGIPYYVIVDAAGPVGGEKVLAYRRAATDYVALPRDPDLGCFIPRVNVWLRWAGEDLVVADEAGQDIATGVHSTRRAKQEAQRADEATLAAEAEKQRADAETSRAEAQTRRAEAEAQRADEATQRGDDLARELAALKARLTDGAS